MISIGFCIGTGCRAVLWEGEELKMREQQIDLIDTISATSRDVNKLLDERLSQHARMKAALEEIRETTIDPDSEKIATEALG